MTMKGGSRFGLYLLVIALFGVATIVRCFAQEGRSVATDASAERGSSPPRSGDDASGTVSTRDGQSTPRAGGEVDGIDTRITVLPRRPGDGRDKAGDVKVVKPVAPRNLLARRTPAPGASEPAVRNAIGVSVVRHEGLGQPVTGRGAPSTIARNPAVGANGIVESPASHFANAERRVDRAPQTANPIVKSIAPNHGGIDGTGLTRRGSVPSGIGGPATFVAGINGTSIRPKHSARP
jgi:hypothetical protein